METLYSWPLWKPSWLTKDLSTQSLRKKDSNGSTALPRLTRISLTNYRIRRLRLSCLLLVQESRHPSPRIIRTLAWAMVDETRKPYSIPQMKLTAILTPAPEGGFVAYNPETGTSSQGDTESEAFSNIREATELFLEEFPESIKRQPFSHASRFKRLCCSAPSRDQGWDSWRHLETSRRNSRRVYRCSLRMAL